MKSSKEEVAAVASAGKMAKAKAPRKTAAERKEDAVRAKDLWLQTTKIVVPAWFGNCSAEDGIALAQRFTAPGLLALVCVGMARTDSDESTGYGAGETSLAMRLRPNGFDRQEARLLAEVGFQELKQNKLVKVSKRAAGDSGHYYTLSAKGQKWFDLIQRSAGCASEAGQ